MVNAFTQLDNTNGVASLLSLAKLFKRNVYWAKDVILLVTDQGMSGTQAWLDAYHGTVQNGKVVYKLWNKAFF